ncbi:ABC-2 type transport system permease protein [Natronorubrum sediminis]|uniref:ABC-2 type transport system permease protein n=1 Tax=Natronorubrum sediminis TaxID=640943 RepID=A0A1H6G2Q4_9EURY|nr:ABC transporter permease subunit [Natronorubrum sediminis]SEH16175.1 ABC-2 type transport system permease protein [Natronorubrum sediminis]
MLELARYDGRHRLKGSIYLSIAMSLLAVVVIWIYPSFSDSFEDVDEEFLQAYPDQIIQLFDIQTMTSLEGFLAFELYIFGWVILLGLYLAYLGAGSIADDVERGRMDILLSMPVSRTRVVTEKFLSLSVPIVAVNVITPVVVYAAALAVGESLSAADLAALHALSIPYLFACAGIGVIASVAVDRTSIAQRIALGATFGLFMLESLLVDTDYESIGAIAPMRYFDPNEVILESTYDLTNVVVLLTMTLACLLVAQYWFSRRDIN